MSGANAHIDNVATKIRKEPAVENYDLVHLIQYHSDDLATGLLGKVRRSDRADSYCRVSPVELKQLVGEIYHHLEAWLLDKSESDIARRYTAIGARRFEQNIPLDEVVWVIVLTKRNLWEFIDDASSPGRARDIFEKQELLQLVEGFFDHAIHAAIVGYERAAEADAVMRKTA